MAKKTKNLFTLMQPVVRKDSEIGQVEITGATVRPDRCAA